MWPCVLSAISQPGDSVEEARANLVEAVELFLDAAAPSQVRRRLHGEIYVTRLAVARG